MIKLQNNDFGLYVDDDLSWKYHIDNVYNKLIKFVGIFQKNTYQITPNSV